jgi:XTP/dITP diphosphohydrolase
MQKLLVATTNPGKLAEIRKFLDVPFTLVSLKDVGITDAVEETGKTFEENAILKAKHYAKESGLTTLADDGGFEIDALGGEPGIHSHRWVHKNRDSSDEELIAYTFERMKDVPLTKRQAQLRLVLVVVSPEGKVLATVEDKVRGIVALEPSKTHTEGFPYRSILYLPAIQKFYDQTVMTPEETDRYNHRKRALMYLKPFLHELAMGSV